MAELMLGVQVHNNYKEEAMINIEDSYEEQEGEEKYDNLSTHHCSQCGARLRKDEFEDFEDECTDCIYENTAGLVDDVDYEEEEEQDE
jgi:hypothetical protein